MGDTYQPRPSAGGASAPTTTNVLKGDGSGGITAATTNTDYLAPSAVGTTVASLSGTGNTVPRNQLPNISGAYWQTVANQSAMLALTAPDADTLLIVYRQDQPGYIWYLNPGLAPATLSNWQNVQEDAAGAASAVQTNLNSEITRATNAEATKLNANDASVTNARTPTAHKSTHATGGSDALAPSDIGAATTAQGTLASSAVQPGTAPTLTGTNFTGIPESGVTNLTSDLAAKAPVASPTFTGTVSVGNLAVSGTINKTQASGDAILFQVNGTTAFRTANGGASLYSPWSFYTDAGYLIQGVTVVDNSRNAAFASLTVNGKPVPAVLSTPTINASTVGNTALYTVPTGKTCVVTGYVVRVTAATAITNGPAAGVGNAAGTNNIAASQAMNGLTSTATTGSTSEFSWPIVGMTTVTPAGGTIYFNLGTAATGTSETLSVDLIGYLF